MGKRLRDLKKNAKGRVLADGKTIGGKGRLTDVEINKIQAYYGNAIRGNTNNLVKMRNAVWAIFFHKLSHDAHPVHNFCLVEWCPYKQAQAQGTLQTFKHKNNLPEAVMEELRPIFRDLAKTELLRKCVRGYTQNANESMNNLVWKFCPKTKHHGLITAETAVAVAVCLFNDGCSTLGDILQAMKITAGEFAQVFFADKDTLRIVTAQRQAQMATKESRKRRRLRRLGRNEEQAEREGFPYLPGAH